jgi:hypothetical protein
MNIRRQAGRVSDEQGVAGHRVCVPSWEKPSDASGGCFVERLLALRIEGSATGRGSVRRRAARLPAPRGGGRLAPVPRRPSWRPLAFSRPAERDPRRRRVRGSRASRTATTTGTSPPGPSDQAHPLPRLEALASTRRWGSRPPKYRDTDHRPGKGSSRSPPPVAIQPVRACPAHAARWAIRACPPSRRALGG